MCSLLRLCLLECLPLLARCIRRVLHEPDTYSTLPVKLPIATVAAGKFLLMEYVDASIGRNIACVHVMIQSTFALQWLHKWHRPAQTRHRTKLRCCRRNLRMDAQSCHSRDIGHT